MRREVAPGQLTGLARVFLPSPQQGRLEQRQRQGDDQTSLLVSPGTEVWVTTPPLPSILPSPPLTMCLLSV